MTTGLKLLFINKFNLIKRNPVNKIKSEHMQLIRASILSYIESGVLEHRNDSEILYYMDLKSVDRPNDPLRPRLITDGSELTRMLQSFDLIQPLPTKGDLINICSSYKYAASVDLKDAFHNIPIFEPHKGYLGIIFEGKTLVFARAPFGIGISAKACQTITTKIASLVSSQIKVTYDDFILYADTIEELLDMISRLIKLLEQWKLPINHDKSKLIPTKFIDYLQYTCDLENGKLFTKSQNIDDAFVALRTLTIGENTNKLVQSVIGTIEACLPTRQLVESIIPIKRKCKSGKGNARQLVELAQGDLQVLKHALNQARTTPHA